ncbi:hypothetical protein ABIA33_007691 [Streptacidiphilus sp. MAP12-16]|uniref:hypothetical protein n=1 Tax=Streptacidiphilus sp. MAP12-16 TaxID=3156300 RepID=UPI00351346FF
MTTKQGRLCGCRCTETTAGGKFRPGHDSKIVPQLEADHGSLLDFWSWYEEAMSTTPPPKR